MDKKATKHDKKHSQKPTKNAKQAKNSTPHAPKSQKAPTKHAKSPDKRHEWDLAPLFPSLDSCDSYAKQTHELALDFQSRFQGSLSTLSPADFHAALRSYENLIERLYRVMTFAFLTFAENTQKGDIYARYELETNNTHALLVFFELEFCEQDCALQQEFIAKCKPYGFYLQSLLDSKPYQLSLSAEQALIATSSVGVSAFSRLFDEHLSALKIGRKKQSEEEVLALLHSPKRSVRKSAQKSFTKSLKDSTPLLCYILNMVRKDLSITTNLRHYPSKEAPRHLSNHISQKSVDSMIALTNSSVHLVHEYYRIKSTLLGHKLKDYDRYAPLFATKSSAKSSSIAYTDALELVQKTYTQFSKEFGEIVDKSLQEGWVSSHPMPNKRGGAFSHGSVPSAHPYVLLNWTGNRRDTFTIAHEFGHMIHQELSKGVGVLSHDTPLTTAETASVFGEMLLFDYLKPTLSKSELLSIYAGKLEDIFSTLFRQVVMTNFERAIHAQEGELKAQDFDRIWQEENAKMFGKSVKLTKNYARWWSYIPHFIHSPFYCYAYSYGQLLVLALFGLYKSGECKDFVGKYRAFLAAGGSKSPSELVASFGLDIESDRFWEIGMKEVEKMLKEFRQLVESSASKSAKTSAKKRHKA